MVSSRDLEMTVQLEADANHRYTKGLEFPRTKAIEKREQSRVTKK